jgi:hypothetical protein
MDSLAAVEGGRLSDLVSTFMVALSGASDDAVAAAAGAVLEHAAVEHHRLRYVVGSAICIWFGRAEEKAPDRFETWSVLLAQAEGLLEADLADLLREGL